MRDDLFRRFVFDCVLNFRCSYNGRFRQLEQASLHEGCLSLQQDSAQTVLSDVDIDGAAVRVEAGFVFIQRSAQTPGDAAVSVAGTISAVHSDEIDEVVAMVRVRSAGGSESAQAIFKSELASIADV